MKASSGELEAADLLDYLSPFVEPAPVRSSRSTGNGHEASSPGYMAMPRSSGVATSLNIPPEYGLIYRVWMGGIAVLSQLDVRARFAQVLREYLPGFTDSSGLPATT